MTANQAEACHTEAHIPAGAGSLAGAGIPAGAGSLAEVGIPAGAGILLAADTTWLAWLADR